MGAPTVGLEKLDSNQAKVAAEAAFTAYISRTSNVEGKAASITPALVAVLAGEVGGGNGIEPLCIASSLGLPVIDGDLMGRAFPELQMCTTAIYGLPLVPAALADEKGNVVVVEAVKSAASVENLLRPLCTAMGCSAGYASCPLPAGELRGRALVAHSLSLAWRLGKAVVEAQHAKHAAPHAVAAQGGGKVVFTGKVMEVERNTTAGFARGHLMLLGMEECEGQTCMVRFQNENLVATVQDVKVASVPDLIACLELESKFLTCLFSIKQRCCEEKVDFFWGLSSFSCR